MNGGGCNVSYASRHGHDHDHGMQALLERQDVKQKRAHRRIPVAPRWIPRERFTCPTGAVIEALTAGGADTTVIGGDRPARSVAHASAIRAALTRALADAGQADDRTELADPVRLSCLQGYLGDTRIHRGHGRCFWRRWRLPSRRGQRPRGVSRRCRGDAKDLTPLDYAMSGKRQAELQRRWCAKGPT